MARRLVLDSVFGESRLERLVAKLHLLCKDSRKVSVSARPSPKFVENDPRLQELKSQVSMREIERATAVAVAASRKRGLDALKVRNAQLASVVMRLHSKVGIVKQFRAKVTRLGRGDKKGTAFLTGTANKHDEAVEKADYISAHLAAGVRIEDAYRSELTMMKKDFVGSRLERASLQ